MILDRYSEVVIGSYREGSRDLPDEVCHFTPDPRLVLIICICRVFELVADEFWSHPGLHQVPHELAQELETFNSSEIHLEVTAAKFPTFADLLEGRLVFCLRGLPEVAVRVLPDVGNVSVILRDHAVVLDVLHVGLSRCVDHVQVEDAVAILHVCKNQIIDDARR